MLADKLHRPFGPAAVGLQPPPRIGGDLGDDGYQLGRVKSRRESAGGRGRHSVSLLNVGGWLC
jgi:hypothetical protein